jgi:hypothetical protein
MSVIEECVGNAKNPELSTEFEQTCRSLRQNKNINDTTIEQQLDMTIEGTPRVLYNQEDNQDRRVFRRAVNSRPGLTDEEY